MSVTQWLYRGWNMRTEIAELQRELDEARDRATSTTSRLDSDVVSGTKDPHKWDKLADLSYQTNTLIARDLEIQKEIQAAIMECDTYKSRHILRLRFVDCKTWNAIDNEMNYSERQRRRIFKKALEEVTQAVEKRCP